MAKQKKSDDYKGSIKARKHIEKVAKEVSSIDDHVERAKATSHALKSYYDNEHQIIREHRAYEMELMKPPKKGEESEYTKLYGIWEKIDEEHKGGKLKASSIDAKLKDFANILIPSMHDYKPKKEEMTPDFQMLNMESMKNYLNSYDVMNNQDQGTTYAQVREMLKDGHGHQATSLIIKAILDVKKRRELGNFLDLLFPADEKGKHFDFMLKASEKMAEDVNKSLKGKGDDYKVSSKLLGKDRNTFLHAYQLYANGEYDAIKKIDKGSKGK
jgi:hypothetical protein